MVSRSPSSICCWAREKIGTRKRDMVRKNPFAMLLSYHTSNKSKKPPRGLFALLAWLLIQGTSPSSHHHYFKKVPPVIGRLMNTGEFVTSAVTPSLYETSAAADSIDKRNVSPVVA